MENETQKSNLLEITGLWANKSKNGETYYSGYMGKSAILIFKNQYKTEDKHPDLRMFVGEGKRQGDSMRGEQAVRGMLVNAVDPPSGNTSDIPF